MAKLKVPYVQQSQGNTCMAAVLSAVYKYYGLNRSEMDIWTTNKTPRLEGEGYFMLNEDVVKDARDNGFSAELIQINLSDLSSVKMTLKQLKNEGVPVIICNQYSKEQPEFGHARIITDISNTSVYMHDPDPKIGGASQGWNWSSFMNSWQKSGKEVTGGIYIVIKRK